MYLLHFICFHFCVLSLLVFVHDHNGHDEEANVGHDDQYHWDSHGPDELCVRIQVAAAKSIEM